MVQRLGALSRWSRFAVYIVGGLLLFSLSVGMGAVSAVVVGWQSGVATTGFAENSTSEVGKSETTGATRTSEDPASEPSTRSRTSGEEDREVSFVHRATDDNSRGDYTVIRDPSIDGDPNAIVLVSLASNQGSSYQHNIGVWYAPAVQRWAIFNQDLAPVPAGTSFEVRVPQASTTFVHEAGLLNTAGNYTYLDNRLTNGKPDATLSVTQNWNPGGGRGVYNNHPVDVVYDAKVDKWAVNNRDGKSIPEGAAFNIAVSAEAEEPVR